MRLNFQYGTRSISIPNGAPEFTTTGIDLAAYRLTVDNYDNTGTLVVDGNSSLTYGSMLDLQGQGTGMLPPGPLENNGFMNLYASTLTAGAITGDGIIAATRSTIDASSCVSSEMIVLHSAYLDIGGQNPTAHNPGMNFLAPVEGFDSSDSINLENTHATFEVFFRQSGALYLFDGPQMVAHMTVHGSPTVYATQNAPLYGAPSINLTATNPWGHAIPVATI